MFEKRFELSSCYIIFPKYVMRASEKGIQFNDRFSDDRKNCLRGRIASSSADDMGEASCSKL